MFNSIHRTCTQHLYRKMCTHQHKSLKFLFRKMRASILLGLRLVRNLLTVRLAFENILSDGVDVAGMHSKLRAITANLGKRLALSFHHISGLAFLRNSSFCKILFKLFSSSEFSLSHHLVQVGCQRQWFDLICVSWWHQELSLYHQSCTQVAFQSPVQPLLWLFAHS